MMQGSALVTSRQPLQPRCATRRCAPVKATPRGESDRVSDPVRQAAVGVLGAAALSLSVALSPGEVGVLPAWANLPSGVTITSARALLRNALPIENKPIRKIQRELEAIDEHVRIPGNTGFGQVARAARKSLSLAKSQESAILADVTPSDRAEAAGKLEQLRKGLPELIAIVNDRDKNEVLYKQQELLEYVNFVEEAMVQEFPFSVPSEYGSLPQLKGRAVVEMKVNFKEKFRGDVVNLKIVLDGYNAPITAGSFVDLVQKKFYDGMEIQRADGFVVQSGRPSKGEFYIDPKTNAPRLSHHTVSLLGLNGVSRLPLEVKVATDKEPIYEESLEDVGRFNEQPALPFNAYGTLAMARSEFDNNSGSCQFFFLLKESELTPSGSNLLDGRYAVFGYVIDGQEALANMKVGDVIESVRLVRGGDKLQVA